MPQFKSVLEAKGKKTRSPTIGYHHAIRPGNVGGYGWNERNIMFEKKGREIPSTGHFGKLPDSGKSYKLGQDRNRFRTRNSTSISGVRPDKVGIHNYLYSRGTKHGG